MNDKAQQAKKKMTGTRAKQKRMGSMAILSALFGVMGGFIMGSGGGGRSRVSMRGNTKASRSDSLVEQLKASAKAKRVRKAAARTFDHAELIGNYYRGEWKPHPAHDKPTYKELRARMNQESAHV